MVAGPIKPDWHRVVTRILAGLAKKFAIADAFRLTRTDLNHADLAVANRAMLPVWLLAYGIKIYTDSQRLGALCGNVNQPNSCGN